MMYPVVILAGGLATRLRPLTETIPKSLIEINGEPFIAHQLRLLQKNNIKKIILCVGYLGEQIIDYLNHHPFHFDISYSFDGDISLGTAGAIQKARSLLTSEHFFVLYGDSYLPCDYAAVQEKFSISKKISLMTVFHNQGQWDKSNVEFRQNKILVYDKQHQIEHMHYIDYGLGVFHQSAFDIVQPNQPFDLALLYQHLLKTDELTAFEVSQRFYEVGSFSGITELKNYLGNHHAIY